MNIGLKLFRVKNRLMGYVMPEVIVNQAKNLFLTPNCYALKNWEVDKEKNGRRIEIGDGLSGISWGASSRKVLLVHGWSSRGTLMSGFVDELLQKGFQVIALDGPAHGKSHGKQTNLYDFAKAVSLAYQTLGPFDGIVAHSMGGAAASFALREDTENTKLVLISTPNSLEMVLCRFSKFIGLSLFNTHRLIRMIEKEAGQPVEAFNTAKNLSNYGGSGMVIHDKSDDDIPYQDAEEINGSWHSARLVKTSGLGHRAILRQPSIWQEVADFLK